MATRTHGGSHTDTVTEPWRGVSTPPTRGSGRAEVGRDRWPRRFGVLSHGTSPAALRPSATKAAFAWCAVLTAALGLRCAAAAADVSTRTLLLDGAVAGDAIVAVGERGTILRSTDQAHIWSTSPIRTPATLTGVTFADAQHGWAVGHDAVILASSDGGATWSRQWQGENLSDSFLDVLAVDAQHVIAVGAYGLYVTSADGGHTWSRRRILPDDFHLNRISRGPTGTLYVAGEHGTLLRSTDRGDTWTPIPSPYDGSFYGIVPLGPQTLLAHGLRGRVYRSANDGAAWSPVDANVAVLLATGAKLHNGLVILAGQARALLISRDDGATFTRCDVGVSAGIAELLELPNGALLTLGEAGAKLIPPAALDAAPRSADRKP